MKPSSEQVLQFLRDKEPNSSGYRHSQILAWADDDWETTHDFIQWLFPTDKPSQFNADAPVLDAAAIAIIRIDPAIQANYRDAYGRWLRFAGLEHHNKLLLTGNRIWTTQNHNWLRATRILESLLLANLKSEAEEFYSFLATVRAGSTTHAFWRNAYLGK